MIHYLFAFLYLSQLAHGTSTDTTSSDSCPPPDGTTRSVWSILGSCGLTLLICVWHTIHFPVPKDELEASLWFKGLCGLGSFFAPEVVIAYASQEWWKARDQVKQFRDKGFEWSMTHSFFAEMGGFFYHRKEDNEDRSRTIKSLEFLELCEKNEIANPLIKVKEIRDKSKSDWLGKAILALQLLWFMLQVVVRGSRGLAVTLVELDTVCMAVLSLIVLFLWWHKPLRPECPHIFYSLWEVKQNESGRDTGASFNWPPELTSVEDKRKKALSDAWKSEPTCLEKLIPCFPCTRKPQMTVVDEEAGAKLTNEKSPRSKSSRYANKIDELAVVLVSLCVSWMILGGLHLTAWNFDFPTEIERIMWRGASLILAGGSLAFFGVLLMLPSFIEKEWRWVENASGAFMLLTCILGVVSRALLVGLMFASLRALPCSAHKAVSWTVYIPHL